MFDFGQITAAPLSPSFPICTLGKLDWVTFKGPSYSHILSRLSGFSGPWGLGSPKGQKTTERGWSWVSLEGEWGRGGEGTDETAPEPCHSLPLPDLLPLSPWNL